MQGKERRWVYLFPVGLGLYERSQRKMRLHQILVAFDFTETLLVALCRLGPRLRNKWLVRQMTKSVMPISALLREVLRNGCVSVHCQTIEKACHKPYLPLNKKTALVQLLSPNPLRRLHGSNLREVTFAVQAQFMEQPIQPRTSISARQVAPQRQGTIARRGSHGRSFGSLSL